MIAVMFAAAALPAFTCDVVRVHDGDGPLWCRSSEKVPVAVIQATDYKSAEPYRAPAASTRCSQAMPRRAKSKTVTPSISSDTGNAVCPSLRSGKDQLTGPLSRPHCATSGWKDPGTGASCCNRQSGVHCPAVRYAPRPQLFSVGSACLRTRMAHPIPKRVRYWRHSAIKCS
jgi:hypothetical protein